MRCHYMSDLHLEAQDFRHKLPRGDVLIIAGDLCHASALDPLRTAPYCQRQRERVLRFIDVAAKAFAQLKFVPGNHEHHDGVFEDTVPLLRRHLAGVTILDDDHVDIDGVRFFGTTLWTDLAGRQEEAIEKIRRGTGDYFFTRTRRAEGVLAKLRPADTLTAHDRALRLLRRKVSLTAGPLVVISHHAPSLQGLNALHSGNGLDGAFASDLEDVIASLPNTPVWVHGHTHIHARYRIGDTTLLANCLGFEGKDQSSRSFSPNTYFEV